MDDEKKSIHGGKISGLSREQLMIECFSFHRMKSGEQGIEDSNLFKMGLYWDIPFLNNKMAQLNYND